MMKLAYISYEVVLDLEENKVNIWVIENPSVMTEIIFELIGQCEGQEGNFVLSEETKILNIARNISFIKDPFSVDCNNRKILTRLYQEIEKEDTLNWNDEQQAFYSSYVIYLSNICQKSDFMLTFLEKPNLQDILKMAEVKIEVQAQTLLEKIIEYIKISNSLLGQRIFVFLNLKLFLTEQEIKELYKEVFYKKVHLILIEATWYEKNNKEKMCIIDKDKCVIYS